jgi:hypothetical protein
MKEGSCGYVQGRAACIALIFIVSRYIGGIRLTQKEPPSTRLQWRRFFFVPASAVSAVILRLFVFHFLRARIQLIDYRLRSRSALLEQLLRLLVIGLQCERFEARLRRFQRRQTSLDLRHNRHACVSSSPCEIV